ncbi:MAG: LysR family transcriptional regulator [Pseudomonadota bacterium]
MFALTDYESVIAIAEEAHFGRAARRLNVTQPALSSRLRRIEEELGVRLFDRDRGGVSVTPAGEQFVEGAERVITAAEETAQSARNAQAGLGQTLRIGMTQVAAYQIVIPTLIAFRAHHPNARVKLYEGTTAGLEKRLEQGMIDAAFLHPPLHAPDLSETFLLSTPMALFDGDPDPMKRKPMVAYPRSEAPVLMGALARQASEGSGEYPAAEADTMLGAIILSRAGFGPFAATADYPTPFEKTEACLASTDTGLTLETSIARRLLDRRPMIETLIKSAVRASA